MASEGDRRSDPEVERRSRLLGGLHFEGEGARGVAIALLSTAVFDTNDAAVQSLKNKQIDGLVVDLPTAFYVTAAQVPNSTIIGQFPTSGTPEHFGMVLAKGNSLTKCIDGALAYLRASGTLAHIQQKWLAKAAGAPVLK